VPTLRAAVWVCGGRVSPTPMTLGDFFVADHQEAPAAPPGQADPAEVARRADEVLAAYRRTGHRELPGQAVALYRDVLAATAHDHPDRAT
jgi:hypothetical protein